ncbi:hypothetical protein HK405_013554 [Cladochytrium tenue]|nr:hypothetical protein HK405_013554 [Cladochytrium tenue]
MVWAVGGSTIAAAYVNVALFLWLSLMDSVQQIGVGMMLLQSLTRFHMGACLLAAQIIGALCTMLARATAPDNFGPGPVFPNLALGLDGVGGWFWSVLIIQFLSAFAMLFFFKNEQLAKP